MRIDVVIAGQAGQSPKRSASEAEDAPVFEIPADGAGAEQGAPEAGIPEPTGEAAPAPVGMLQPTWQAALATAALDVGEGGAAETKPAAAETQTADAAASASGPFARIAGEASVPPQASVALAAAANGSAKAATGAQAPDAEVHPETGEPAAEAPERAPGEKAAQEPPGAVVSALAKAIAPGRGEGVPGTVGAIVSAAARGLAPPATADAAGTVLPDEAEGQAPRSGAGAFALPGADAPSPEALAGEDGARGASGGGGTGPGSGQAAAPSAQPPAQQAQPAPQPSAELARLAGASVPQPPTAQAGPPAPPAPPMPVLDDVPLGAVPIAIGMRSLAGASRFEIRLDPPELGRIAVSLTIEDGEVSARLVVDRVETLQLLSRDAKTLERAFEQAGLKAGENAVQISLREQPGAGDRRDGQGNGNGAHAFGRDGEGEKRSGREGRERGARERLELIEASGAIALRTGGVRAVDLRI